jgi:hypothetical protein
MPGSGDSSGVDEASATVTHKFRPSRLEPVVIALRTFSGFTLSIVENAGRNKHNVRSYSPCGRNQEMQEISGPRFVVSIDQG